jgi:GH35 family endo-1,4-beta-xylanase
MFHRLTPRLATVALIALAAATPLASSLPSRAAEINLANFNSNGFNWQWGDFAWTTGPTSVRLYDPIDSTGGGGRLTPGLNLSSFADGRFVIDVTEDAGNGSDLFYMALEDTSGNRGTWALNATALVPGTPTRLVSQGTLAHPTGGTNPQLLNLSQIRFFQIDGQYGVPRPFDMTFDNIAVSTSVAAPPPYPGHEPNAPWRAEAAARIDAIRKADLAIHVKDAAGQPLAGATVGVAMQQHEFGFGSAVIGYGLRDNNPAYAVYKQHVEELFNIVTLENDLKWPPWVGQWGSNFTPSGAHAAVDWLAARDIRVRGHNVIWPGYNNLPTSVQNILNGAPLDAAEQQALRNAINFHIDDMVSQFAGDLSAWDVVNEPWDNHDVMDNLAEGNAAMIDWFQRTRANDPHAVLYLNDYNILSTGGSTDTPKQQFYYDTLRYLQDNGAPIGGVGFQGHFSEDTLTGPEQLWTILDRFNELGLDMQVTEFDVGTDNEQLQADYTRDFLTAMFAHEGVDDVVTWGFWEGAFYDPRRAMFRTDWSIKPNGQAWLDLVKGEWWTDELLTADSSGDAELRGFKGEYEITVTLDGKTVTLPVTLSDDGLALEVTLPLLAGDFNADGRVDRDDLLQWQGDAGVNADSDADNDGDSDGADFLIWQRELGAELPSVTLVPEPAALLLCCLIALALAPPRRTKRTRLHRSFIK